MDAGAADDERPLSEGSASGDEGLSWASSSGAMDSDDQRGRRAQREVARAVGETKAEAATKVQTRARGLLAKKKAKSAKMAVVEERLKGVGPATVHEWEAEGVEGGGVDGEDTFNASNSWASEFEVEGQGADTTLEEDALRLSVKEKLRLERTAKELGDEGGEGGLESEFVEGDAVVYVGPWGRRGRRASRACRRGRIPPPPPRPPSHWHGVRCH